MLVSGQEREFNRGFTGSQANELRYWRQTWRSFWLQTWRLRRQKEFSRKFMNCSLISTRSGKYQEHSRDYHVTSLPLGKSIKASSDTKNESVGVRSAVKLVNWDFERCRKCCDCYLLVICCMFKQLIYESDYYCY
ncbi:hypothetical protein AVEN_175544-1 [Araneus ventricosus]|uniref:Uncharacterized protein n=1 Tax=Araneus ventricosus TaxID=182803 RepID=A0A4Y2CP59_ARAVE|nr:hypothetical protein AVEN_175544-1 [Araneus ventricosus]